MIQHRIAQLPELVCEGSGAGVEILQFGQRLFRLGLLGHTGVGNVVTFPGVLPKGGIDDDLLGHLMSDQRLGHFAEVPIAILGGGLVEPIQQRFGSFVVLLEQGQYILGHRSSFGSGWIK